MIDTDEQVNVFVPTIINVHRERIKYTNTTYIIFVDETNRMKMRK